MKSELKEWVRSQCIRGPVHAIRKDEDNLFVREPHMEGDILTDNDCHRYKWVNTSYEDGQQVSYFKKM